MKPSRIDGLELPAVGGAATRSAAPPAFRVDVVRSLRQHGALALSVGTLVFALIVLFALSRKPMYKAESLTYVEPLVTRSVDDGTPGVYDPSRYDSYLQQQIQTAARPDILEQAIATLPLGTWQQPGEDVHLAAARLAGSLKVQRVGQSYQLSISLMDGNPRNAAMVVNAATTAFLQQGRHDETVRQGGRLQLLQEERTRIQGQLASDQNEQTQLGQQLGVADPAGTLGNPYDSQLASIRAELVSARQAHDIAAAQLSSIALNKNPEGAQAVADDSIASDASVTALKQTITQRRALLNSQMAQLTPSNPVYKQDQQEIAQLDKQLDGRVSQLRNVAEQRLEDKLRLDLERTGDVESRLNGQLAQQTALAHTAAPRLQRATELAADITRLENRYTAVDEAIRSLSLDTNGPGTAHLAVAASVPSRPEPSRQNLLFAAALPLALLAGIGAAVFARKRDPHLYTEGDVEEQIGFLPMVAMPALEEVSSVAAEEYLLRMAAALERAYRVGRARTFVFTAASAATDISGFVHALRVKLIGLGFKTQAMSADEALRVEGGRQSAAVRPGQQDGYAAASLDRLKTSFDIILLEAQPLMHSAEAEYAVRTADATILVVESALTTNEELRDCALLLQRVKAEGVGVALLGLHRNVAGAEMRASIAEAERRRPSRISPVVAEQPKVLEERVYDMMERRARNEVPLSGREDGGKLDIVEPKRAVDDDPFAYEDRSSFQNEEQDGTPYVECVTAARSTVTQRPASRTVSSASTREVPVRDETERREQKETLRRSLAQVEFNDNNLADDLPDGSPAVGRSFFKFFERRSQEEESPAIVGSEIERAFDRVLKRPEPGQQRPSASQEFGQEPVAQLPSRYIPAEAAQPIAPEPLHGMDRMEELVAAEPMQPAWSSVPEAAPYETETHELTMPWRQRRPVYPSAQAIPAQESSASHRAYTSPSAPEWPMREATQSIYVPAADYVPAPVPAQVQMPVEAASIPDYFPHPEVEPFAREQRRAAAARMLQTSALERTTSEPPAPGEFRYVAPADATPDPLRSELLAAHATALDPAGSLYVLRDDAVNAVAPPASSALEERVAEPMTISSARSAAAAAAQRLAARMAAELPATSEFAPFQRREPVLPKYVEVQAEPVPAVPSVPASVPAVVQAAPTSDVAAFPSHDETPGWLSSAEADRIRQLLARFSDGVSRSQVEEPAPSWFAQPHTSQTEPVAATRVGPPADANVELEPVSSVTVPQPSASEIHFGFSSPLIVPPVLETYEAVASPVADETFAASGFAPRAHAVEEEAEAVHEVQWPSWPTLSRHVTPLPSDHHEAASRPWYETFEEHFLATTPSQALPVAATAAQPLTTEQALPVEAKHVAAAFARRSEYAETPVLSAAEPAPLATAYAAAQPLAPLPAPPAWQHVPQGAAASQAAVLLPPIEVPVASVEAPAQRAEVPAARTEAFAAPIEVPVERVEAATESMAAPVVIQVPEPTAQPVIEPVNHRPSHSVLPTNPISALYSSQAQAAGSRASAEAVFARTLPHTPLRSFEDSGPLYFREAQSATPILDEDTAEMPRFNGNGHVAPNGNGHGAAVNGNGHASNDYRRMMESTPSELVATETQFEAPIPWKTRKPPVPAAVAQHATDLTPQPGRWGMLSRFDPHSANADDVLGPAAVRRDGPRDDSKEEPMRKIAAR